MVITLVIKQPLVFNSSLVANSLLMDLDITIIVKILLITSPSISFITFPSISFITFPSISFIAFPSISFITSTSIHHFKQTQPILLPPLPFPIDNLGLCSLRYNYSINLGPL